MPDYSDLPTSQIDADSALIEDTLIKLRDNPIAMFEAAPGAPKAVPEALDLTPAAGIYENFYCQGSRTINSSGVLVTSYLGFEPLVTGTYTLVIKAYKTSATPTCRARIYRNVAAYGTLRTISSTSATAPDIWTQSLALTAGDNVQLRISSSESATVGLIFKVLSNQPHNIVEERLNSLV